MQFNGPPMEKAISVEECLHTASALITSHVGTWWKVKHWGGSPSFWRLASVKRECTKAFCKASRVMRPLIKFCGSHRLHPSSSKTCLRRLTLVVSIVVFARRIIRCENKSIDCNSDNALVSHVVFAKKMKAACSWVLGKNNYKVLKTLTN